MNVSRFIALFCDCFSLFEGPSFFISKLSRSNRSYCLFGLIYEMQKFSTEIKSVLRRVLQALKYWLVLYHRLLQHCYNVWKCTVLQVNIKRIIN